MYFYIDLHLYRYAILSIDSLNYIPSKCFIYLMKKRYIVLILYKYVLISTRLYK